MPILAFRSTAGDAAPDSAAVQTTLTNFANAVASVTAYCNALRYANLTPVDPDKEPDWFGTLSANLATIKTHAQTWLDTIGPSMTTVPQAIINFNNSFQGQSETILGLLAAIGYNPPTPQQKKDLLILLTALYDSLQSQQQQVLAVNANLVTFNDELGSDFKLLSNGADSISHALQSDKNQLTILTADINALKDEIINLNHEISELEIARGVTIFLGVIGALVAIGSGGVGAGILVVSLTGVAIETVSETAVKKELVAAQAQLLTDQNDATAEVKQIAVLNGISATVGELVKQNVSSGAAMNDILATWGTLVTKMKAVVDEVQTAENDIGTILDAGDVRTAGVAWGQLTAFATSMQTALGNLVLQPLVNIPVKSAAA